MTQAIVVVKKSSACGCSELVALQFLKIKEGPIPATVPPFKLKELK